VSRGILETIYVKTEDGVDAAKLKETLKAVYDDEYFVTVLDDGTVPQTRHVRGSNHCIINVFDDRLPGRCIIVSVIDNLVKGASGQAVQNMNLVCGFPEEMGISMAPVFP